MSFLIPNNWYSNMVQYRIKLFASSYPHLMKIVIERFEKTVLERDPSGGIASRGYRNKGLEKPVLERELSGT